MNCLKLTASLILITAVCGGSAVAQVLPEIKESQCTYGDCENGRGTLEMKVEFGKAVYQGNFRDGQFQGYGRVEVPISFTQRAVYTGNWENGIRSGRGTYYDGKGDLYIGQWRNDKRHGHGSYFFGLKDWKENEHTEFWMSQHNENYTGDFVNDLYQGQGVYHWPDGSRYEGGFFANEKHGFGTYYYSTGTARQQLWDYGDFVR